MRRRIEPGAETRPAIVWGREPSSRASSPSAFSATAEPTRPLAPVEPIAPVTPPAAAEPLAPRAPLSPSAPVEPIDTTPQRAVARDRADSASAPSRRSRRTREVQPPAPQPEAAAAPDSAPITVPGIEVNLPEPVAAQPEPRPVVEPLPVEPVLGAPTPAPAQDPFEPTSPAGGRRARRARVRAEEPTALPEAVLKPAEPFELLEPLASPEPVVETEPVVVPEVDVVLEPVRLDEPAREPESSLDSHALREEQPRPGAAAGVDEFAAAAALFSFTGETPIQESTAAREEAVREAPAAEPAKPSSPRRPRTRTSLRRIAATGFSVGVMGIVGLLTVGMTTPIEAVAASSAVETNLSVLAATDTEAGIDTDEIQAYVTPADTENADLTRDENYDTVTMAEIASESGISNYSSLFVNDPNSAIQWPFAVGVPMSYGYGIRSGVLHEGIDFVPGYGAPIQAIADGTVRIATNAGGAYGVTVVIDHEIDGQLVSSRYAHMIYGSLKVVPGQKVTVGQIVGSTGNTGRSYGAHLHFEILMDGTTAIDPLPWLRQYAGG